MELSREEAILILGRLGGLTVYDLKNDPDLMKLISRLVATVNKPDVQPKKPKQLTMSCYGPFQMLDVRYDTKPYDKIMSIKIYRQVTGSGLKEAKDIVEHFATLDAPIELGLMTGENFNLLKESVDNYSSHTSKAKWVLKTVPTSSRDEYSSGKED